MNLAKRPLCGLDFAGTSEFSLQADSYYTNFSLEN
jgi:hypothetical protein